MMRLPLAAVFFCAAVAAAADDPTRVLPPDKKPDDARLTKVRTLNDKDFLPVVPATKQEWEARRKALREQVMVANGLWPLPERTPLEAVVHGKIDREGYTVEKVFFASTPGHYVSGNLYRPKGKEGKLPGVLFAHGHWANGRLYEAPDRDVENAIKGKGEKFPEAAKYPLQALPAQLARMGCVVFHYDMIGVADSKPIPHAGGFSETEPQLRLQSAMGLQTWNSLRALDFLTGLPDVDAKRIGMTGASGGGTQTFILSAIDDRPAVAFPAVMVSCNMQGGCVCENAPCLRLGAGNVDFAALFAPKPLGMSAAKDWTHDIEERGLPELKRIYKLYDAEDKVMAKAFLEFGHNYNQVSREVMYGWFNKHLGLGLKEPIEEQPFVPVPPKELSVFDEKHPRPKDAASAERMQQLLAEASDKQIEALRPKDAKGVEKYREVFGPALRSIVGDALPASGEVEGKNVGNFELAAASGEKLLLGRKGASEQVPAVWLRGKGYKGNVVVWVHPDGKSSVVKDGKLIPEAAALLEAGSGILAVDLLGTGEFEGAIPPAVNEKYAGYTHGYNRSLLGNRVHDILTAVASARGLKDVKSVSLVGFEAAGPWVLLARGLCGDAVARTAADFNGFRFESVRKPTDDMMLPGALKYAGLPGLAGLAVPGELFVYNHRGTGAGGWLKAVYESAGAGKKIQHASEKVPMDKVVEWLVQ